MGKCSSCISCRAVLLEGLRKCHDGVRQNRSATVENKRVAVIQKLRNISYEMRLKECGLTTLETSTLRGDQIEVFKI